MKYALLTTRHTSNFLLWDSATTEIDVAQSGNTTDVCKEFVKEVPPPRVDPGVLLLPLGRKDLES